MIGNVVKLIQPLKTKISVPTSVTTSVKSYIQIRNIYELEKKKKYSLLLSYLLKRKFIHFGINMKNILLI